MGDSISANMLPLLHFFLFLELVKLIKKFKVNHCLIHY
jgi:hypothetical protein